MPDKPTKPDKRKILKDLADRFGKAYLIELVAQRKHQDSLVVLNGARTPTPEERAISKAAKSGWMARSRERLMIGTDMENLLGIVHKQGKSPRDVIDGIDGASH